MNLTDEQIKQALAYCNSQGITSECEKCKVKKGCRSELLKNALDLINRLEAENNVLHRDNDRLLEEIQDEKIYSRKIIEKYKSKLINAYKKLKRARTESVKEFAERLKKEKFTEYFCGQKYDLIHGWIDNLVKEMTGESG